MANYCNIKNNKKIPIYEIQDLIVSDLKAKFNLEVETSTEVLENGENYLEFKVKDLIFPFWFKRDNIEGYDVPSTAFDRHNQKSKEHERYIDSDLIYHSYFIYAMLYDYFKNVMAKFLEVPIDTANGDVEAFSHCPEKYDSGDNWLNYWKDILKKRNNFLNISIKNLEKYREVAKNLYPELFAK